MDTLNDYLNAPTAEQDTEREKRGWAPRPPIAHTHRGVERTWLMAGYHAAIQKLRTPAHRAETRDA